ncbi:MAG: YXWGXW repeat-containing protein, partial [Bryobacteraceae bacterium]
MKIKLPVVALAALLCIGLPLASSSAYVGISVGFAPPPIPVYEQPLCPTPGYIWTPGYWGYADSGYYWVPGVWVAPPQIGVLWTPGYWGYSGGSYVFNNGYWGPTVGFYGGINYGYGYGGRGYYGGRWSGNTFLYNTAVTHVNRNVITNTYADKQAVAKNTVG